MSVKVPFTYKYNGDTRRGVMELAREGKNVAVTWDCGDVFVLNGAGLIGAVEGLSKAQSGFAFSLPFLGDGDGYVLVRAGRRLAAINSYGLGDSDSVGEIEDRANGLMSFEAVLKALRKVMA